LAKVFIVDDDLAVRESLIASLSAGGYRSEAFDSGALFLERLESKAKGCVILDFEMPGLNGLQVLERLHARGETIPVIFFSGCNDVKIGVAAVKQGAFDFLTKPFGLNVLYERVDAALAQHVQHSANLHAFHSRLQLLTPREREVMQLTVEGSTTKRIAAQLGITQQTAIRHRSRVLDKMEVGNEVQLVHLVNANSPTNPIIAED